MKFIPVLFFVLLAGFVSYAQERQPMRGGNGEMPKESSISGTVTDAETNQAVEYASVVIFSVKDSTIITGTITDQTGYFLIDKLSFGKYYMDVDFIGYRKKRINNLFLNPGQPDIKIGAITINKSVQSLNEVEILGEKTLVEYKIDKKVINVGKDIMSEGGTAVDVLENTPSVETDIDGNVSLRGSSNFTVLIDGKPTLLSGSDALQQIPASSILNIEIITNPSVKYDPDGTAGIINVILKKQQERGFNGIVNASVGNFGNVSTDGILNYRLGKVNLFAGFDYNQRKNPGTMEMYKETYLNDTTYITEQKGDRSRNGGGYNFKAGIEYDLTSKDFISFSGETGNFNFGRNRTANYHDYTLPATIDEYQVTENNSDVNHDNVRINSFYQHKFKEKGHQFELVADYTSGTGENADILKEYVSDSEWNILQNFYPNHQQSDENTDSKNARFKWDYVKPMGKNGKFESGLQSLFLDKSTDYKLNKYDYDNEDWLNIDSLNNLLYFDRQIHSAYMTYSNVFMNFEFMAGLRSEYTYQIIKQMAINEKYLTDRIDFFPSFHISREITENNQIQASYSRRVNRPNDWELDPFPNYMDQNTIRKGNPALEPEFADSYELNYQHKFKKSSFVSLETYYRQTNNLIENVSFVDSNNIMISAPQNFSRDFSIGAELMGNIDLYKWLNVNISFDAFNYNIEGEIDNADISQSANTWSTRLNTTIKLKYGTQIQINASYRAPSIEPQEKEKASFSSGAAIRQDFFKRKLTLSVRARDLFGSHRHASESFGSNFYSSLDSRGYYPMISFSVSYKINNFKQKKKSGEMDSMDYGGGDFMD